MGVFYKNDYSSLSDFIYPCRWEEGPSLTSGRSSLSSLMSPPHLVCPETNPLAHSCPALGDTEQTCTLEPGSRDHLSGSSDNFNSDFITHIVFVHEVIFNPTQVTRFV